MLHRERQTALALISAVLLCLQSTLCSTQSNVNWEYQPHAAARSSYSKALKYASPGLEKLQIPKVALLFMTRGPLPHEPTWKIWLAAAKWLVPLQHAATNCKPGNFSPDSAEHSKSAEIKGWQHLEEQALFSVYVHPGSEHEGYHQDSVFSGQETIQRVKAAWGKHTMVVAMRVLLREALADSLNQRFAYLCEQSIPLYPPTVVWQQLMTEQKSRINACIKDGEVDPGSSVHRWSVGMLPHVTKYMWVKSSQWATLTRAHAELVDQDTLLLDLFGKHCKGCVGDEHYLPVLIAYHRRWNETTCSGSSVSVTWGDGGAHPLTWPKWGAQPQLLLALRHNIREWKDAPSCKDQEALRQGQSGFVRARSGWKFGCVGIQQNYTYNDTLLDGKEGSWCTLFARKFGGDAVEQVLTAVTDCDPRLAIAPRQDCGQNTQKPAQWPLGQSRINRAGMAKVDVYDRFLKRRERRRSQRRRNHLRGL